MEFEFESLDAVNLTIIFFFLVIIFLANHLMKKRTQKTMDHINNMLDQEYEAEEDQNPKKGN